AAHVHPRLRRHRRDWRPRRDRGRTKRAGVAGRRRPSRGPSLVSTPSAAAGGPTSRSYVSQRLRLRYVDWGNPEAPPLLLVHGGRAHSRNWDWVAQRLRHQWHVIAPDLRGHGDSQWADDGNYAMTGYVYDLAQLIHEQRLAPVTIVAHSLGGVI